MLIPKHLRKRFQQANQNQDEFLLRSNIKDTDRVDFVSRLSALMKDTIKNQFSFRARSEDEDVSAIFVEMLERDIKRIQEKFDFSKKMIFSLKDKDDFEKARNLLDLPKRIW